MSSQSSRAINAKINAILRSHVHKSYAQNNYPEAWRNLPEIPSSDEIRPHSPNSDSENTQEQWDDYQKDASYDPKLPFNIIDGPWGSKIEYIGAHYQILREDSVAALRRSVSYVKEHPDSMETEDTFMYTHVSGLQKLQICGS
jgi:helicase required for RNAi-mediated heterochromatin assembly 1